MIHSYAKLHSQNNVSIHSDSFLKVRSSFSLFSFLQTTCDSMYKNFSYFSCDRKSNVSKLQTKWRAKISREALTRYAGASGSIPRRSNLSLVIGFRVLADLFSSGISSSQSLQRVHPLQTRLIRKSSGNHRDWWSLEKSCQKYRPESRR